MVNSFICYLFTFDTSSLLAEPPLAPRRALVTPSVARTAPRFRRTLRRTTAAVWYVIYASIRCSLNG